MDVITNLVAKGNSFLWSFLLIVLLCGTGIYYTIRLRFIQVRKFGEGWKLVFGHLSLNGEKHEKGGDDTVPVNCKPQLQPRLVPVTWQVQPLHF